jgi:hypothetical protein
MVHANLFRSPFVFVLGEIETILDEVKSGGGAQGT